MVKRSILVTFTLLILSLTLTGCSSDSELSEEDKVRATLAAIEEAAEKRSLSGMTEHVSESYQDYEGNDFKRIKSILQLQILKNQNINIFSKIRELNIAGSTATVELSVAIASTGIDLSSEANRLRADTYRFSVVLNSLDGQWKIKSLSWQRGW